MKNSRLISLVIVLISIASCTLLPVFREGAPEIQAARPDSSTGDPFPNWPHPPDQIEALFQFKEVPEFEIVGSMGGTTGALKVDFIFPGISKRIAFKWKLMVPPRWVDSLPFAPGALDGVNNSPRKEIAAFEEIGDRISFITDALDNAIGT